MIRVAVAGLVTVFLCIMIKPLKSEYAALLSITACIMIFFLIISRLSAILESFSRITSSIGLKDSYMGLMLKIIGIAYIGEFASNVCKDAGYQAVSGQIEMVGKITILSMSLPVFLAILNTVEEILG